MGAIAEGFVAYATEIVNDSAIIWETGNQVRRVTSRSVSVRSVYIVNAS